MKNQNAFALSATMSEAITYKKAAAIGGSFFAFNPETKATEPVRFASGDCYTTTCGIIPEKWVFFGPLSISVTD